MKLSKYFNLLVNKFVHYLGWRHWAIFYYNPIIENFFILVLFHFLLLKQDLISVISLGIFLIFSMISISLGYFLNDAGDIKIDLLAGKYNIFSDAQKREIILVISVTILLALISGYIFFLNFKVLVLWILWLMASWSYSLPPFRLKTKGLYGLFMVVAAQRILPIWIALEAFGIPVGFLYILSIVYVTVRGFLSDINHQLEDYHNDISTKVNTSVVKAGFAKMLRIFRTLLHLENVLLILLLCGFGVEFFNSDKYIIAYILFIFAAVLIVLYVFAILSSQYKKEFHILSPFIRNNEFIHFLHLTYPNVLLTIGVLFVSAINSPSYFILLLYFTVLYSFPAKRIIKSILAGIL